MKKTICLWIAIILMCLSAIGCGPSTQESTPEITTEKTITQSTSGLKVTMLDVGQGLSVLIENDGHYMIYDGGNRRHSSYIVSYLKQHNITDLDYLIASHYDEDHIAGLVGVLNTASVNTAIIPNYNTDSAIYASFMDSVKNAELMNYAEAGKSYKLGNATIDILYACIGSEESENNMSTVLKVSDGKFSCILSGDAEYTTEEKLVSNKNNLNCTLYVVGHHGSSSSSTEKFIEAMSPEIAFISVGADNSYGHPTEKTLKTLAKNNVIVYRTDTQGVIGLEYINGQYTISTEKNDSATQTTSDISAESSGNLTYVLNNSSMKFHLPDCSAVEQMADYNKGYSTNSRDELIEQSYSPCKICNP